MCEKYGAKKDNGIVEPGDFWYFKVEGITPFDTPIAKSMRDDETNRNRFRQYLHEKYWHNWLNLSEDTEDDCRYLHDLRWEAECEEIERERRMYEEIKQEEKSRREEEAEMERKLAAGEITRREYTEWEFERDDELYNCFENASFSWYDAYYQEQEARAAWKQRKTARDAGQQP
jgi:hypothetical protein